MCTFAPDWFQRLAATSIVSIVPCVGAHTFTWWGRCRPPHAASRAVTPRSATTRIYWTLAAARVARGGGAAVEARGDIDVGGRGHARELVAGREVRRQRRRAARVERARRHDRAVVAAAVVQAEDVAELVGGDPDRQRPREAREVRAQDDLAVPVG